MGRQTLNIIIRGLSTLPSSARKDDLFNKAGRLAYQLEKSKSAGEICILFVSRKQMLSLNEQYLGHSYDTDVISFSYATPTHKIKNELPALGDIYISAWMAKKQALEMNHSVLHEALTLVAHGALHLLGHDDKTPQQKAQMFKRQDQILKALR